LIRPDGFGLQDVPGDNVRDLHGVRVIAVIVGRGLSAVIGARGLVGNGAVPPGGTLKSVGLRACYFEGVRAKGRMSRFTRKPVPARCIY
jgi:hypothetical protein